MTFGQRLKKARLAAGLTQKQLAARIDAKHNSISNWENDQNRPGPDTIEIICGALHISPNALLMDSNVVRIPKGFMPLPRTEKKPLVGSIACGTPILAEENIEGYIDVPVDMRADFVLRCVGDSMIDAGIRDGDLVYIRIQPMVENGEIAAVLIGEEATLKKVFLSENNITLLPANSSYAPLVYVGEQMNEIRIEGKAVGFFHVI